MVTHDTRLTIIDTVDGVLHPRHVALTQSFDLAEVLGTRPADVNSRIIVVAYRESFSVDREVVDVLGGLFDLDSVILQQHFDHDSVYCEISATSNDIRSRHRLNGECIALLPSEQEGVHQCLHIGIDDMEFASVMFIEGDSAGRIGNGGAGETNSLLSSCL